MADDKKSRRLSGTGKCLFKGSGKATLTILHFDHWKTFFVCEGLALGPDEIQRLQTAANYENYSVEGTVHVEWPLVTVEFNMEEFLGETLTKKVNITLL